MKLLLRILIAALCAFAVLTTTSINAYASCSSGVQKEEITRKYQDDVNRSSPVVGPDGYRELNKAMTDLMHCEQTRGANCAWERMVPFPVVKKNRANDKNYYYVYQIDYYHPGQNPSVYKYGIGRYGTNRMNVSKNVCLRAVAPGGCTGVKLFPKIKGWTTARTIEASLVLRYAIIHGQCPPGQRTSCL